MQDVKHLRATLESMRADVAVLEARVAEAEANASGQSDNTALPAENPIPNAISTDHGLSEEPRAWPLHAEEYTRYGRQMIIPEIGLEGQLSLKNSRALIVGLGGLGCPAARYLAGAGVGVLGLVDDDIISLSNLHRQTLYSEDNVGDSKAQNALRTLKQANSTIGYQTYDFRLTPAKAIELFDDYDLILDCTDHPSSRYFMSDAAVLTGKPLISASALRTEGQLMVLNHAPNASHDKRESFCYRCVFPKPPPPESITTCGEGGILGPVVGVMGVLMAMEAIKILTLPTRITTDGKEIPSAVQSSLLLYSAYSNPPFRTIRLKGKRTDCISCSANATITRDSLIFGSIDYVAFCGIATPPTILPDQDRISASDFAAIKQDQTTPHILIDVRESVEFGIAHIDKSINIPFSKINRDPEGSLTELDNSLQASPSSGDSKVQVHFVCKLGNDSQTAVAKMRNLPDFRQNDRFECRGDIKGGLWQWKKRVDPTFPDYGGFPDT